VTVRVRHLRLLVALVTLASCGGGAVAWAHPSTATPTVIDLACGGTDDTAAVRAAFLAVPMGGATIRFPPTTCVVDPDNPDGGPVELPMNVLKSNTRVIGRPGASVLKLKDGSFASNDGGILLRNENASGGNADIWIEGVTFDGNDRGTYAQTGGAEPAFRCSKCTNLTIRNSRFLDTKYHAIHLLAGSALSIVDNHFFRISQVRALGDAIQANGAAGFLAQGNTVENSDEGIFCQHEDSPPTLMSGCSIVGNVIRNLGAAAKCETRGIPYACCTGLGTGTTTCTSADQSGCLCAAGVSTGSSIGVLAQGARVTDNVIDHAAHISVQGLVAATLDVVVADNRLVDLALNAALEGSGAIVVCAHDQAVARVQVRGNTVRNTRDAGIRIACDTGNVTEVAVTGNAISSPCTTAPICGGIFVDAVGTGSAADVTIVENSVAGSAQHGLRIEGPATDVHLGRNDLRSNAAGNVTTTGGVTYAHDAPGRF
jgi:hypothetical protein